MPVPDLFACRPDCPLCNGTGHVCENHPDRPWGEMDPKNGCHCGGAGMLCRNACGDNCGHQWVTWRGDEVCEFCGTKRTGRPATPLQESAG